MKRCTSCGLSKQTTAFGKSKLANGKFVTKPACKECLNEKEKRRNESQTPEQKIRRKDSFLRRLYGITIEDYNRMLTAQNFACASCGRHQSIFKKALVVDHDHKTGKVLGILCSGCNLALGNIGEDPEKLIKLASYIREANKCA